MISKSLIALVILLIGFILLSFSANEAQSDQYRGCIASANQSAHKFPDTLEQNLKVCDTLKK